MIDGIPNRPLYFYQKDIIGKMILDDFGGRHGGVQPVPSDFT